MVSRLKEIDAFVSNQVDQPMFLRHASRPASAKVELEWLRFPHAVERIPKHRFHQFQDAKSRVAIRAHPVAQILTKLRVENGKTGCSRSPGPTPLQVPDSV